MSALPPEEKKNLWELAGRRIGVMAAAVGLLIALVGLPHTLREALGQSSSSASDLTAVRDKAQATGPRLDVRYLLLTTDVMRAYMWSDPNAAKGTLLRAEPILWNDVLPGAETVANDRRSCKYEQYPNTSVAFLEVSNRGLRDATNIVVDADRLTLPKPVRVREAAAGGDDYNARLRASASSSAPTEFPISRPLGPGEAVRLPLFVSDAPADRYDRWCALPGAVYLPLRLRFDDPALATTTHIEVRRMQAPLLIARGAFERG